MRLTGGGSGGKCGSAVCLNALKRVGPYLNRNKNTILAPLCITVDAVKMFLVILCVQWFAWSF